MTVDEALPPSTQPNTLFRFTSHYFMAGTGISRFTRDFRYPTDIVNAWPKDWPPGFLWDFIYGVITSREYGNKAVLDILAEEINLDYYPEGVKAATDRARADIARRKQERDQDRANQKDSRDQRAKNRENQDHSDAFDSVFCLWIHHRFGPLGQRARAEEEAESAELQREQNKLVTEKVARWQKGVEGEAH